MSKSVYSLLNTIQVPKQQFQVRNNFDSFMINNTANDQTSYKYHNHSTVRPEASFANDFQQILPKDPKTYVTMGTQTEDFLPPASEHQSRVLLSLMESVDLENFKPRQAQSIMERPTAPFLINYLSESNPHLFKELSLDQHASELLKFISERCSGVKDTKALLDRYQQVLQRLLKGVDDEPQYFKSLSFQNHEQDQHSPGWGITPTMKVQDSFITDSLLV